MTPISILKIYVFTYYVLGCLEFFSLELSFTRSHQEPQVPLVLLIKGNDGPRSFPTPFGAEDISYLSGLIVSFEDRV